MKNKNHIKQIVCAAFNWREVDYQVFQFNAASEYLKHNIVLEDRIAMIWHTDTWWMWWNRQWDIIDRQYISTIGLTLENVHEISDNLRIDLMEIYMLEHDASSMKVYMSDPVRRLIKTEYNGKLHIKDGRNSK